VDFDLLNQAEHFYLREIGEPRDNSLRLVIEEAVTNRNGKPRSVLGELPELQALRESASPIESVAGCRCFELIWDQYAAYLVTEELAGTGGNCEDEVYEGKRYRIYTKSNFLDHLAKDVGEALDPIQHYKLICLNHLIDIAAAKPPRVTQIPDGYPTSGQIENLAR